MNTWIDHAYIATAEWVVVKDPDTYFVGTSQSWPTAYVPRKNAGAL